MLPFESATGALLFRRHPVFSVRGAAAVFDPKVNRNAQ